MRKFDDVEHAEEQREADGHQRIHHAEHQPIHGVLGEQASVHVRISAAMPGFVPGTHVHSRNQDRRGWPGPARP
jgi:hypothetical protein